MAIVKPIGCFCLIQRIIPNSLLGYKFFLMRLFAPSHLLCPGATTPTCSPLPPPGYASVYVTIRHFQMTVYYILDGLRTASSFHHMLCIFSLDVRWLWWPSVFLTLTICNNLCILYILLNIVKRTHNCYSVSWCEFAGLEWMVCYVLSAAAGPHSRNTDKTEPNKQPLSRFRNFAEISNKIPRNSPLVILTFLHNTP